MSSLRGLQGLRDGQGDAAPALGFGFELPSAGFGEAIEFCAAVIFGVAPEGRDPAFFFHAVEAGKERAGLYGESAAGDLFDPAGDPEAVHFAGDQGLEDEHIQGALQERCGFGTQDDLLLMLYRRVTCDI